MSSLGNINLRVDKLPQENFYKGKNGAVYCMINISINDDSKFGNNVAALIPQSEEERAAKKAKEYLGNGKIYWTDGSIKTAEKDDDQEQESDNLPF
jgi:hypothetical protein